VSLYQRQTRQVHNGQADSPLMTHCSKISASQNEQSASSSAHCMIFWNTLCGRMAWSAIYGNYGIARTTSRTIQQSVDTHFRRHSFTRSTRVFPNLTSPGAINSFNKDWQQQSQKSSSRCGYPHRSNAHMDGRFAQHQGRDSIPVV
jgi:hypothetical protein